MPKERIVGPPIANARADRYPQKTNVYSFVQGANSQLAPLFPHFDPGSLVPCIGYLRGDGDHYGYFLHSNSVDEVVLCFGCQNGRLRPGQVAVGAHTHPVAGPSPTEQDPSSFYLMVLTQRQSIGVRQHESVVFVCESCQGELHRHDFDVAVDPARRFQVLETISGSEAAADAFNADEAKRRCGKCGHLNAPFPKHKWGWQQQVSNAWIAEQGLKSLEQSAAAV